LVQLIAVPFGINLMRFGDLGGAIRRRLSPIRWAAGVRVEERLAVLAEISVGLAGFSSIVVVFRRRSASGAWKPEDVFRFKIMLEAGLVAGLFAILPGAIAGLGFAASLLWPFLSALLLGYLVFDLLRRVGQFGRLPSDSLNRNLASFIGLASLAVIGVQTLNIADWLVPRGPGPYLFGVTWLTAYSGLTFYRLMTAPVDDSGQADLTAD
jgi:hypothetical protein